MNVFVYGYGLMGKKVVSAVENEESLTLKGVISPVFDSTPDVPTYQSLKETTEEVEGIIDFSHPANLDDVLSYALAHHCKVVIATTGYNEEQLEKIREASKQIPIFQSYNTSYGVAMMMKMVQEFAKEFYDHHFDIEILEAHHNRKVDAPSGTAKMLYDSAASAIEDVHPVYDRSQRHEKRAKNEIGIQSLRAGTIFGEHTVMFAGEDEIVEIKHTALSKEVFAQGAVSAMKALASKESGLYDLKTLY